MNKKRKHPEEAPIFTARGNRITVRRDEEGRTYTDRKINPETHILGYDDSVNYCDEAVKEANRRGIAYHRIDIPGRGTKHISQERLMKEGRNPRFAKYPQKGLPLSKWTDGEAPPAPEQPVAGGDDIKEAGE